MRGKNLTEGALNKALVAFRIDVELKHKVMHKYGRPGGSVSDAFKLLVEDAVAGVKMSKKEIAAGKKEIQENYRKRMEKRQQERISPRSNRIRDYSDFIK